MLLLKKEYLDEVIHKVSLRAAHMKDKTPAGAARMIVHVADHWPRWKVMASQICNDMYIQVIIFVFYSIIIYLSLFFSF